MRRRALLGAAALLAGCGAGDDPPPERSADAPGGDSSLADAALLNDALAAETRAAPLLPGSRANARRLERAIRRMGADVQRLTDGAPPPADARAAADELVALYVDLLAKLADGRLRGELAGLLAAAAEAGARARAAAGQDPAPEAFAAGRAPE